MTPDIVTSLLNLGLPGIVIIMLALALKKRDSQYTEVQEKRILENSAITIKAVTAIEQNTAAIETLTLLLRESKVSTR